MDLLHYLVDHLGFEAIKLINNKTITEIGRISPDLILLDHWLDTINGDSLCSQIKAHAPIQRIPFILLSARHNIGQIARQTRQTAFCENLWTSPN